MPDTQKHKHMRKKYEGTFQMMSIMGASRAKTALFFSIKIVRRQGFGGRILTAFNALLQRGVNEMCGIISDSGISLRTARLHFPDKMQP